MLSPVEPRSGIGYDAHAFVEGRPLLLGGVRVPHSHGLAGHSDADALLHAIGDALLGAAGAGDIGKHFPPDDQRFKDADSRNLLAQIATLINKCGWRVGNVDATVIAEGPRIGAYTERMCEVIATCLGVNRSMVNVKATTNETMGFVGRGEGIAALAIVTVFPISAFTTSEG
ncbi:MAG: 2-C-methyl-D-erythritol 2,4-cyclodiphosphate synthase [Chloroflexota bacterium]|nr:2-C-methyl-D-erythritol 2,4-cyclodiphosphate synthase [Chloroflexota bacterium]